MKLIKKTIPLAIVFTVGILTLLSYYVPHKVAVDFVETVSKWENIVMAFAFMLGLISLFRTHYGKINKRVPGWGYSVFVFIGFLAMVVPAIVTKGRTMDAGNITALGWSYRHIYNALAGTMFAVLAFYIVSTAYRSFRIKSAQAFVLFVAAFILILGKVPLGQLIWDKVLGWTGFSVSYVIDWIMTVPAVAGKRGIMIGIAIGAVVTSFKIIFGIEKQYLGRD